jgi:molybdopterin-guanine dinucleotide biosynthesis protein A
LPATGVALGRVPERLRAGALKVADLGTTLEMAAVGAEEAAEFGPLDRLLANVNTPEDFARIESSR